MEKDYEVILTIAFKNDEPFVLLTQNNNKIYIPYYKLNTTIKGIEYIKATMEMKNG